LFAGGQTDCFPCGVSNVVDIYDIAGDTWSIANLSVGRELLIGLSSNGKAAFAGGDGFTETNIVDIYDESTDQWSTATLSQARTNLSGAVSGGKGFFVGGNYGTNSFSDVVDIFVFSSMSFLNSGF